jgi:hypothetical protein
MAHARTTDPLTSHEAAATVTNVERTKLAIKYLLMKSPKTDLELIEAYELGAYEGKWPQASQSGIRTRRSELVEEGWIEATGEKVKLPSGRYANTWRLKAGVWAA